jgi:hypothetical protein
MIITDLTKERNNFKSQSILIPTEDTIAKVDPNYPLAERRHGHLMTKEAFVVIEDINLYFAGDLGTVKAVSKPTNVALKATTGLLLLSSPSVAG